MSDGVWRTGRQDTVTAVLARAVRDFPDRIFLDFSGELHSYAEVDAYSNRIANGLAALGVKAGDRVGSLLDTNYEAVALLFGVNKLGAINVPVNAAYKGEYLRHQFDDAGVEVVVVEPDYAPRVADIWEGLPHLKVMLQRGGDTLKAAGRDTRAFDNVLGSAEPQNHENKPDDISMLIYTGGTTGPSKGCIISHNYVCNLAWSAVINGDRTMNDVNWSPLPLFHMNALGATVLASALTGGRAVLYPRFSVSNFWPDVRRCGATLVNLLGSMIAFIADAPDTEDSRACYGQIRAVRGSPFSAQLQEKWRERFGVKVAGSNVYGLTEAAPVTSLHDNESHLAKPGSSGRLNDDYDVRIVDGDDNEVPPNVPGEIVIRPKKPNIIFGGYWGRPEDTLAVMRNMWLHSGDIGKFDEDGYFFFIDRKKDYLRRRGENISSFEVETSLRKHPAIADVAVHAVFSETAEDEVKATLVLRADAEAITEEELCRWSAERLPYFAVPRYFEFRKDLPRNPVGRVLKYTLRDEGCTPGTWDREAAGVQIAKR
jgi:crotonobetaine/carnitine-CoA ligase